MALSGYGMGSCWDGWRFTFDRCCFVGEACCQVRLQQGSFEQFCGKAPAFHAGTKLLLRPPKPPAAPKPGSASSRPAGKPLKLFYRCLRSFFAARYGMLAGRFHLCLLLCLNGVIGRALLMSQATDSQVCTKAQTVGTNALHERRAVMASLTR